MAEGHLNRFFCAFLSGVPVVVFEDVIHSAIDLCPFSAFTQSSRTSNRVSKARDKRP